MHNTLINEIIFFLKKNIDQSPEPMTREIVALYGKDPYKILVSCLLSLQNRDSVTLPVSVELFKHVQTADQMVKLPRKQLEFYIKSINYYKTKAERIQTISQLLLDQFDGKVPNSSAELMSIKGIGIKTANLVLAEAFDIPAICVDTHVHRLSNKWELVQEKTAEKTEKALRKVLPREHWIEWNYLLVKWGQHICKSHALPCNICYPIIKMVRDSK